MSLQRSASSIRYILFTLAVLIWAIPSLCQGTSTTPDGQTPMIPTGLEFLDQQAYDSIPLASSPSMGILPASSDLTSQFPEPGNQGIQNSCTAWAVAYALKTYQEALDRHWPLVTDDHIFSPSFLYNQLNKRADCKGGLTFVQALNLLHSSGVASLQDFPYKPNSCADMPSADVMRRAQDFKIGDYRRVNVQDDTEVKSQIASGNPVLIGVIVDESFWKFRGAGSYSQFLGPKKGNHALVLVGYDDSKQSYKLINSWGTDWASHGVGWITYDAFRSIVKEGYVIQDDLTHSYAQASPGPSAASSGAASPVANPSGPAHSTVSTSPPMVVVNVPTVATDVLVFNPYGPGGPGVSIVVPGQLTNAVGRHVQIVARFVYPNGQMLRADPHEPNFRDFSGFVAVGTPDITVNQPFVDLSAFPFSIPYYILLDSPPTNGARFFTLSMYVSVYVNAFLVFEGPPVQFSFRY